MTHNSWNAALYDAKCGFVSELGKGVLDLLNPQPGEEILDIGCGTGDLTHKIAQSNAIPFGIDSGDSMIIEARKKYPNIKFQVSDAREFKQQEAFDAVFSNAVFHWIKDLSPVLQNIWMSLKPKGRLVVEFGGKGNVASICEGINTALSSLNIQPKEIAERNPWQFPSIGEFASLLEKHGFKVEYAILFDRPTVLQGEHGLTHWLEMFAQNFFHDLTNDVQQKLYEIVNVKLKDRLYTKANASWIADYTRIRVLARKLP